MEPMTRVSGVPEVMVKVTDTATRKVLIQFPYPIHRPHLPCFPKHEGSEFAAAQIVISWRKLNDSPWIVDEVWARGRFVKHNGRLSGTDIRECRYRGADAELAPPLLLSMLKEYAP